MLDGIGIEIDAVVEQVLASQLAVTAKLRWRTVTRPVGWDPNDESSDTGAVVAAGLLEFRALFHQVDHRLSGFQKFMEVQTGDVILDYAADLALANKEDVRIEVNGRIYTQKNASTGLMEAWDAYTGHGGTLKSILLTPAA
jgi:hypothetical protein